MIGGEDRQIAGTQCGDETPGHSVKPFQMRAIAPNIAPMTIEAVELDEIGECQAARFGLLPQADQMTGQIGVGLSLVQPRNAAMAEDIADLAHGMGRTTCAKGDVQNRIRGGAMA